MYLVCTVSKDRYVPCPCEVELQIWTHAKRRLAARDPDQVRNTSVQTAIRVRLSINYGQMRHGDLHCSSRTAMKHVSSSDPERTARQGNAVCLIQPGVLAPLPLLPSMARRLGLGPGFGAGARNVNKLIDDHHNTAAASNTARRRHDASILLLLQRRAAGAAPLGNVPVNAGRRAGYVPTDGRDGHRHLR